MALSLSTGPFGPKRRGEFNFDTSVLKPHTLYFEDTPKRVRAVFGGETVADSRRARLLFETAIFPVYYFPEEDVCMDLLRATDHTTHCPFKGDAAYWTVRVGDAVAENAAWAYPEPKPESAWLEGYVALYREKMDHFFEEDEEVLGHPRDPYHRIDVLRSSRRVRVSANGETIAETNRPMVLFETSLPPRYYLPPEDVNTALLAPSETKTRCPYKGLASYRSVEANGTKVEDAAWVYPEPLPEAERVRDHLCFYDGKVSVEVG
jgi:uncharacterized protein (DUF427 family)